MFVGIHHTGFVQSTTGIENYQYMGDRSGLNVVTVLHHLTRKSVYTELRYNYEELNTISAYLGKSLSVNDNADFSFSPMAGVVMGAYSGGSLALNTDFEHKRLFFSSQAQYTINTAHSTSNFFYNWSELGYYTLPWLYTGFTVQQTWYAATKIKTIPGFLAGLKKRQWSVPLYVFNPAGREKYFVIGINLEWDQLKKNK
jgi:hypothetical protein